MPSPRARVTSYLVEDHELVSDALATACRGKAVDADAFTAFRAGMLRHIAIEEKLLFPAARRARGGQPLPRARELRVEHAALTSLLVPTPDLALCAELAGLVLAHDQLEEGPGGVYAECEALWTEAASRALLEAARAFPPVRVAPHFDGPGVYRTAAAALAAAARMAAPRCSRGSASPR